MFLVYYVHLLIYDISIDGFTVTFYQQMFVYVCDIITYIRNTYYNIHRIHRTIEKCCFCIQSHNKNTKIHFIHLRSDQCLLSFFSLFFSINRKHSYMVVRCFAEIISFAFCIIKLYQNTEKLFSIAITFDSVSKRPK